MTHSGVKPEPLVVLRTIIYRLKKMARATKLTCTWAARLHLCSRFHHSCIYMQGALQQEPQWLQGAKARRTENQQQRQNNITSHKNSQAHIDAASHLTGGCRRCMQTSWCCSPASQSLESNSTGEEPWGQAQVYPPGRRRQRWLQTSLQGLSAEDSDKRHRGEQKNYIGLDLTHSSCVSIDYGVGLFRFQAHHLNVPFTVCYFIKFSSYMLCLSCAIHSQTSENMNPSALTWQVVSVLLVNADLCQPRVDSKNFDFVSFAELVHLPHFTFVFCRPVHMPLKHIQTVGMSNVWK